MRLASSQKLTGILGLGHVGLTLAAHLLRKGVRIVGIENDPIRVEAISNHRFDIFEPGLAEIFLEVIPEAFQINNCNLDTLDTLFVCVGTSKPDPGKPEANLFEKVVLDASKYLKKSGTLFLRSTVSLGVTYKISQKLKAFGRDDLVVAFAPERTAEGAALFELEKLPQIVGADSKSALSRAVDELQALGFDVIAADSTKTAELSKLMCNVWRDTTFAFSNEMAIIGDVLGVDTHAAISISNFNYPRAQIPTPGPVLGPCLSKDTYILHDGIDFIHNPLTLAARNMNEIFEEHIFHEIADMIKRDTRGNTKILICGLAFKGNPLTYDSRESMGLKIIHFLTNQFPRISCKAWEPNIPRHLLPESILVADSIDASDANIIILANNLDLSPYLGDFENFASTKESVSVLDIWKTFPEALRSKVAYKLIGKGA